MFVQPLLCALKGISNVNVKKPIDNANFFIFFIAMDLICPEVCPKTTTSFLLVFNKICHGIQYL